MTQPLLYVEAPVVAPYDFGLFGAFPPLEPVGDDHWQLGVEWEPLAGFAVQSYKAGLICAAEGAKVLPLGVGTTKATPYSVYAGMECGTVGYDSGRSQSAVDRARTILELAGQHAAEANLWTGAGGGTPALNAVGVATTISGAGTPIISAIRLLEDWVADRYAAKAVIHVKRGVSAALANAHLIVRDPANPNAWMTAMGTRVVFGGGYDGSGPSAVAAAAGTSWAYVTGQIVVRRGPVLDYDVEQSIQKTINLVDVFAEQVYLTEVDGPVGAVLVNGL
jgi:hypothetical protein